MYQEVEQSLIKEYRKNNQLIVKVCVIVFVLIQPILLVFGPLPGYLIYTQKVSSGLFWLSTIFILSLSYIAAKIYDAIMVKEKIHWLTLISGKSYLYKHYCLGQLKFALPSMILLIVGLYKVADLYHAILIFIGILILHVIYYIFRIKCIFSNKDKIKTQSVHFNITKLCIKPNLIHLTFYLCINAIYLVFLIEGINNDIILSITIVINFITMPITIAIEKNVKKTLNQYECFYKLVSYKLYKQIVRRAKCFIYTMRLAPLVPLLFLM